MSSKWIKGNVSRRILVLDTSLFIHFDDKYFRTEGVENRVRDDGVCAILQYRPSDLYLTDRKETMAILQNIPTRLSTFADKAFPHSAFSLTR